MLACLSSTSVYGVQGLFPQLLPIHIFICNTEGFHVQIPPTQLHALPIEPPVSLRRGTEQWCVPSEEKSCMWAWGSVESKGAGHTHQGSLPSSHANLCWPLLHVPLLSRTIERLRKGFPLPLPAGVRLDNPVFQSYQVSPQGLRSPSGP